MTPPSLSSRYSLSIHSYSKANACPSTASIVIQTKPLAFIIVGLGPPNMATTLQKVVAEGSKASHHIALNCYRDEGADKPFDH